MRRFLLILLLLAFPNLGNAQEQSKNYKPGEVIVKYMDGARDYGSAIGVASMAMARAEDIGFRVKTFHGDLNISHMLVPPGLTVEEAVEELERLPGVEYAEPNYKVYFNVPSRPEIIPLGGNDVHLQLPNYSSSSTGPKVIVAVIDTGVDYEHEGLNPYMWRNDGEIPDNGMDDDRNGFIDDYYGFNFVNNTGDPMDDNYHGTHVAGIIAKTVAGVSTEDSPFPEVKNQVVIMALKFLNRAGEGYVSNAIRSISYAVRNGAQILNNSWGGSSFSRALQSAISATYRTNTLFVVAAGNDRRNIDERPAFPPSYTHPNLISVAALNSFQNYGLAYFSNFGVKSADVGAPGVSIRSTMPDNDYGRLSGTSMAAPFVAGAAAAVWAVNPDLNHLQVKQILMESQSPINSLEGVIMSPGLVNPLDGITLAEQTEGNPTFPPLRLPPPPAESIGYYDGLDSGVGSTGCAIAPLIMTPGSGNTPPRPDFLFLLLPFILLILARFRPVRELVRIFRNRRPNES